MLTATLADRTRLRHRAKPHVMTPALTLHAKVAAGATNRVREHPSNPLHDAHRQAHSVLRAERIGPRPRNHASVHGVARLTPVRVACTAARRSQLVLVLLHNCLDAALLKHVGRRAAPLRIIAAQIANVALHVATAGKTRSLAVAAPAAPSPSAPRPAARTATHRAVRLGRLVCAGILLRLELKAAEVCVLSQRTAGPQRLRVRDPKRLAGPYRCISPHGGVAPIHRGRVAARRLAARLARSVGHTRGAARLARLARRICCCVTEQASRRQLR
mmetsp:Transcript_34519/g.101289  ORF Transcript_34519/g.101289 Transcript_34519/m.101289 type:complete len:273 (+) Transcript_34519:38-856(+)